MQKLLRAMHKNEQGFTLVELMVVVVIIGILVAIAIPIFNTVTRQAEQSGVEANLRTVDGAIMMYYAEEGNYPGDDVPGSDTTLPYFLAEWPEGPQDAEYGIYLLNEAPPKAVVATPDGGEVGGEELGEFTDVEGDAYTLQNLPWDDE